MHNTARINGMEGLNYWERLKDLNLFSLERRRERYMIIYVWKIIEGIVLNVEGSNKIESFTHIRRGRLIKIPSLNNRARVAVRTMKESSLLVRGPKLFNCLPREIREIGSCLERFKANLDIFLHNVPDRPTLPNYYQSRDSNSILDQINAT